MVLMSDYAVSKHASTRQSIQGLRCCRMTTVRGRCPQYNCWWTQLCVAPSQTQMHHEFMDFLRIPKTVMSMVLRGRCRSPARACGATPTDRSPVPLQLSRISSVPAICLHMGNQRQVQICKLPYKVFQGHRDKETLVVAMHVAQAEQVVKLCAGCAALSEVPGIRCACVRIQLCFIASIPLQTAALCNLCDLPAAPH